MPKSKKDPNKPKGAKSAYIYFTEREREEKAVSVDFAEFSKECGKKWGKMGEGEKAQFVKMSEKDKQRYEKEMESYIPPSDSDSDDDRPKKKKKKEKDPNAPKKNITAYFHFASEMRPLVKAENKDKDITVTEMAVKIGEKWRKLTDDQKKPYLDIAAKDKARYLREMAEYTKNK